MSDLLRGPKVKLDRAKRHIGDAETAIRDFIRGNPYRMFEEVDRETGEKHVKVDLPHEPIPGDVETTVADAIHNLRVSLDQLACALAALNDHPGSRSTYFPFGNSREHFESASVQDKVRSLSPDAQRLMAEQRPYRGGDDLLWSLHALDLMDKHRQLVPVHSMGSGAAFFGTTNEPIQLIANPAWSPVEDNMTVAILSANAKPEGNFKIAFDVAFGEVEPVKGKKVVAVLNGYAALVERILQTFEQRFFR